MSKHNPKRYSVYERGTDRPICIYCTGEECAKALGIALHSFYKLLWRQRYHDVPKGVEIFEDTDEEGNDICDLQE